MTEVNMECIKTEVSVDGEKVKVVRTMSNGNKVIDNYDPIQAIAYGTAVVEQARAILHFQTANHFRKRMI